MKAFFAAASFAALLITPAFAAEEYQSGPALVLLDRAPVRDTGSAQLPAFNGEAVGAAPRLRVVAGNGAEAGVESMNSETVPLGTWHASIGLLANR